MNTPVFNTRGQQIDGPVQVIGQSAVYAPSAPSAPSASSAPSAPSAYATPVHPEASAPPAPPAPFDRNNNEECLPELRAYNTNTGKTLHTKCKKKKKGMRLPLKRAGKNRTYKVRKTRIKSLKKKTKKTKKNKTKKK